MHWCVKLHVVMRNDISDMKTDMKIHPEDIYQIINVHLPLQLGT